MSHVAAWLGPGPESPDWASAIEEHAARLGLTPRTETTLLRDGRTVAITRFGPRDDGANTNGVRFVAGDGDTALSAQVPLTTPAHCVYAERGGAIAVATDVRLLGRWKGFSLDARGVFALLQHGAIPAPFTIAEGIRRVPPGHTLRVGSEARSLTIARHAPPVNQWGATAEEGPEAVVQRGLDGVLASSPQQSMVFFSGGVDSALIVARMLAIGRRDMRLVNYCFGADDLEARHARAVATELGLACEQITYDAASAISFFSRVGRDYSAPFGDFSSLPTNLLTHAALAKAGTVPCVIDGTGADGSFAIGCSYRDWQRVSAVPRVARAAIGRGLRPLKPWNRTGRLEQLWRVARRSSSLPLPLAAITAQNSLEGVAFHTPPGTTAELADAFATWLDPFSTSMEDRLAVLDLVHVCAGQFAAKSYDALHQQGVQPLFPFLEPSMVAASFALPWNVKCAGGEAKAILKRLLVRHVSPSLVYRRKSGFTPPLAGLLTQKAVGELVADTLLGPSNPLRDYVEPRFLRDTVERSRRGAEASYALLCFLWVSLFTSLWVSQR